MTEYEAGLPVAVAFPPEDRRARSPSAVAEAGWRQFHVAETEKYAHVTYFFNGGVEAPLAGRGAPCSSRARRSRPTTSQPEMSAAGVTDALVDGDRVGHATTSSSPTTRTRTWSATPASGMRRSRRSRPIDACLARVVAAIEAVDAADPDGPGRAARDHRRPRQRRRAARRRRATRSPPTRSTRCRSSSSGRAADGRRLARRRPRRRRADAAGARRPAAAGTG